MSKNIKKITFISLEILMVFCVLAFLALGVIMWRFSSGPVDVEFARPYIEAALRSEEHKHYATMEKIILEWPDLKGPLFLGLQNVKILDFDDNEVVSVVSAALSLSKSRLLIGKIRPQSLSLNAPTLRLIRTQDGDVDIGFARIKKEVYGPVRPEVDIQHSQEQTLLTERILKYIAHPDAHKDTSSPLATLQKFEIKDARLKVEDRALNIAWDIPRLDVVFQSVKEGLESNINVLLSEEKEALINIDLDYDWHTKLIDARMNAEQIDVNMIASRLPEMEVLKNQDIVLNARAQAVFDTTLMPVSSTVDITSQGGHLVLPALYKDHVAYSDLSLNAAYDSQKKSFTIPSAQITARGVTFKAQSQAQYDPEALNGKLTLSIDDLPQNKIGPLWPEDLKSENSYKWLVKRMSRGHFSNVIAQTDFQFSKNRIAEDDTNDQSVVDDSWTMQTKNLTTAFNFDDMSIDYRAPLTAVSDARGTGRFDNDKETLDIDISKANLGSLNITEANLSFIDVHAVGAGEADINVNLNGPMVGVFDYIRNEPIGFSRAFERNKVAGHAALSLNVNFPTINDLKAEQVKVTIEGKVKDVALPGLIQGFDLTGGPFDVSIKDGIFKASGQGLLAGRLVDATYQTYLKSAGKAYSSIATAKLVADEKLRTEFGIDLSDFISGDAPIDVKYTEYNDNSANADIAIDLTSANLFVKPFDYMKPSNVESRATLKASLINGTLIKIKDLNVTAPNLSLHKGDLSFYKKNGEIEVESGVIDDFNIEKTSGQIRFNTQLNEQLKIVINAQKFDLRPFLDDEKSDEPYINPSMLISVNADKMITTDNQKIQNGKIYIDIDNQGRFNQLELDARVGSGDIYLRYKPDESGQRVFRFEADDAGATLRAFGLYERMRGGKMMIYAEPIRGIYDRNLIGRAVISDFKVVKAPGLARLLGSMSLPGLGEALSGDGLNFSKLESGFDWVYRKKGSVLVLKDGRTSGNALGLTFDGTYDQSKSIVDLSGTIVPVSGINKMVSDIPVIGDILSGGSDAVFAATYDVKGDAKDPKISVNPLSVLAPGIIRRILFE